MPKSTITYWNPLSSENQGEWRAIAGLEQVAEELTLSIVLFCQPGSKP